MSRRRPRTQRCGSPQARQRLTHAKSFMEAACCKELGKRSRSEDHHDAEALLEAINPGGKRAAGQLRQLIDLEDTAHYGFINVTTAELKRSLRQAQRLVEFADEVMRR